MSDLEDFEEEETTFTSPFALIAIDTHPSMFIKNEENTCAFIDALQACHQIADELILQSTKSFKQFGIVFANNDALKANFIDIKGNVIDSVKLLKKQVHRTMDAITKDYMRKDNFDLSAFLLFCKKKFKEVKSMYTKRTLIYITNDDNPVGNDANKRFTALNEAKQFGSSSITFQMITTTHKFDYTKFYNEFFALSSSPPHNIICEDVDGLVEKLSLTILKSYDKECVFYPFKGDKTRYLKLLKLDLIRSNKHLDNAKFSSKGKEVKKVGNFIPTTYRLEDPSNGGSIPISAADKQDTIENNLEIGYTLVCISNRITDIGYVIGTPCLLQLHPSEDELHFNSFWQYCVDHKKVLICVSKYARSRKSHYVELIPKYSNNKKLFLVKQIPYENETQPLDSNPEEYKANPEEEKAIHKLIDKLTFDYSPKMFTNVSDAKKAAYIKAKCLDEPVEDILDVTSDDSAMDKRIADVAEEIKKCFNAFNEPKKRKAAGGTTSRAKKAK